MPEYRIRIKGVEIIVDSKEALFDLLADLATEPTPMTVDLTSTSGSVARNAGTSMDKVMLKNFVEAGRRGIPSEQLQMSLGANRKTVQSDLMKWAERVGLKSGNFEVIFDRNIQEGKRGYRLTNTALSAAKDILGLT